MNLTEPTGPLAPMHPIVAGMHPSTDQEPAIRERGHDVVVTAGAGTGKTRTLVARYLSLLAEGQPLRSILAITFTRKAAREMRNRVRDEIRRYLERPELDGREQEWWRDRYTALDAARIGTIHSFCGEVLRAHPAEADLDPRFEVLDEGQAAILLGQAVDGALAWAADSEDVVHLFTLLGERDLEATLEALLGHQSSAEEALAGLPSDLLPYWQEALCRRQQQVLTALIQRPEWLNAVATLQEVAASNPDDRMEVQRLNALAALEGADAPGQASDAIAGRLAALSRLNDINLGGGSSKAWPGGKEELAEVKVALRRLRELWRSEADLLTLALNAQDEALAEAMPALRALVTKAAAIHRHLKESRQALDFDDLEHRALALLAGNPAVLRRWQQEIVAILVDEFQDTNARQRDLVGLLNADRNCLFIVGDAKQSIYRFRGADVAVFRGERERIERSGGAAFTLETSYRAHRDLVQGLNDLLRPVLGETVHADRPWIEPFSPLAYHRQEAGAGFAMPHIELHLTVGSKSAGALNRAAHAVAGRIVDLVHGGLCLAEDGKPRPLEYGHIAILCRASGSFSAYEDALEQAGVPFLTVAGRGFYGRPEIRDLLNALRALADPTDDLALAGLLRSPAFALSDAVLYQLYRGRNRADRAIPLWAFLPQATDLVSEEDGRRIRRVTRVVGELHGQVGRSSVAELLKAFLDKTDYRAALIQTGQARAARNVSKLLADAHASGIVGVGEFLEYVDGLRDTGAREGEARTIAEGSVQIMSVHAAKGLEFPVVILGDITYGSGARGSLLVDPSLGVLLSLKDDEGQAAAVHGLAKERSDDQERAESDRLFYVAATRAREKLILSGCVGLRKDGTVGKPGGWLGSITGKEVLGLEEMTIEYDEEGEDAILLDLDLGDTPVSCTFYEPGYVPDIRASQVGPREAEPRTAGGQVQPIGILPPPLLAPVAAGEETVDPRLHEQERIPPQRVWRVVPAVRRPRAPAWVIGSLVHEGLNAWRFPGGGSDHSFERWARSRARGYGLTDAQQLADAVRRLRQFLLRFRAHFLYGEMEHAERRLHEVPYSLVVDGRVESGLMDALYLHEGLWTVVEFKTDDVRDQTELERVLTREGYLAQVGRYAAATERLLGQRPRTILCMLNYAGEVRLVELPGAARQEPFTDL
ncbi:MAG TPA: UvrD-helicase domain-containing protein [Anaerolineae bacterium]|nr:UvrD-helicase domain-containing protein [Anaerolineae bacterium]